ncbi:MAG: VCBS repeat-containing protein [Acidobacteria bacterium]|nr:VCBS repeat-containing protein [Acidobacteriota bacterium]
MIARKNRFHVGIVFTALLVGMFLWPWDIISQAQVACSSPSFSAATSFAAGAGARSIAAADFNRDGKLDLAVANGQASSVSILLGDGTGGFGAKTDIPVGAGPRVVVTDFNRDGKLDLAVANFVSNTVSILLGDGLGGFGAKTDFSMTQPGLSTVADFNLDGKLDLAVVTAVPGANVAILLGDGMGGFGATTYFGNSAASTAAVTIGVGDFNRDGKPDLVAGGGMNMPPNTNNTSVLLGDGMGGFGPPAYFTLGQNNAALAIGDFNGDGASDLAATNAMGTTVPATLEVLLGDGTSGFSERTIFPNVGLNAFGIAAGDFNRDGKLDLVHVSGQPSSSVSVQLGDGRGGFGERTVFPLAVSGVQKVEVGDFNRDGRVDIAVPSPNSGNVSILLNTCSQ